MKVSKKAQRKNSAITPIYSMKLTHLFHAFAGLTALLLSVSGFAADPASSKADRQYYELRVYTTQNENQRLLIDNYWQKAAIPAYNRAGLQPIGVFTEAQESPTNKIYVLIPFDSLSSFESLPARLAADTTYQTDSADFMNRTKANAPYTRMDISLLRALTGMPTLALPPSTAEKKPWIFELRTYFSPTEGKAANKIAMFNAGEIPVMKEVGLSPSFSPEL